MPLNSEQVRTLVIRPALQEIGLWSPAAEELVLGTGAQESHFMYLHQVKGPALGLFQMEPATYRDIWKSWLPGQSKIRDTLLDLSGHWPQERANAVPDPEIMVWNLRFAAAMCRVFYRRVQAPLPAAGDLNGQAAYWKRYYNTHLGKGTPTQYAQAWGKYVV